LSRVLKLQTSETPTKTPENTLTSSETTSFDNTIKDTTIDDSGKI
jgi:hypothetical protein